MKQFIFKTRMFLIVVFFFCSLGTIYSQTFPTFNGMPISLPTDELTIEYILNTLGRAVRNQSPEQLQTLRDNEYNQLWLHVPSTAMIGENVKFTVQAWDSYERLAARFDGNINISSTDESAKLPHDYKFTTDFIVELGGIIPAYLIDRSDNGKHTFENVVFNTPGVHYIYVEDHASGKRYVSNPIKVSEKPSLNIYWGDIHSQSNFSDGAGFPFEQFDYAKNVAMLDFFSLTDHDSYISPWGNDPQPYLMEHFFWPRIIRVSNDWNRPGDFVTLIGYEWSSLAQGPGGPGYGHYNVYYNTDDVPFYSHTDNETFNIEDLWAKLKEWKKKETGSDVITIPHHITRGATPIDWAYYDPEFVPLVEIYSEWGSSEMLESEGNTKPLKHGTAEIKEKGFSVQDGLSMGRKVSFMGSGDSHDGRPGHSLMHTAAHNIYQYPYGTIIWHANQTVAYKTHYPNGLVAIFSKELERKDVFNALRSRACFATSHVDRMIIEFKVNGKNFYEEQNLIVNKDEPRTIKVNVFGDGNMNNSKIEKIELIKNNKVIYTHLGKNLIESFEYIDYEPINGVEYEGGYFENGGFKISSLSKKYLDKRPSTDGEDFYYVRVTEENGEMGWAGPVWIKINAN
jgi:hypothetical protein